MKKAKWPSALKTAKKAKDKSIFNFIVAKYYSISIINIYRNRNYARPN